jgi:hypothetical protein
MRIKFYVLVLFTLIGAALLACESSGKMSPIEYQRTGGIAGCNDHLVVDAKGHARLTSRTSHFEYDLKSDEIIRLSDTLRAANLASIPEDSVTKLLVPDELSYRIIYASRTIRTSDTTMPAQLAPVISVLDEIVTAGQQKTPL